MRVSRKLPQNYEELCAAAMLLGEHSPIICSCCLGSGVSNNLFGFRRCGQCGGIGYDLIEPKTLEFLKQGGKL
jgi:hypothetical protein